MNLNEINSLAEDPASVSWSVKGLALAVLMGVVLFLGYKLVIVNQIEELEVVEQREQELRQTFETRQKRASQLPLYQAQLAEMEHVFGDLLKQLPSNVEIPGLILDISEKGLSNGLELELFEPTADVLMDFYAEKPIKIIAKGSYRELATFVSDIAGLPRIVTISDIMLKPDGENTEKLRMEAMVRTYRYLDDSMVEPVATQEGVAG
ncbi:type IV pilus inner membrane component PilO [Candidatus Thiothrix anitrata]|jgi:type IV pilus assembly protein PilO|uniref:Type 4a pilus biogenesis protein PilO n=1 Tax=Candidatus Thiothrix anitrata TaxID=2823902 RepID=A0ABX7X1X8_9GAMM|nr:type 4a pilus biogenesis protein PilO [Candidatus Thiothrix anitrata]QTR49946.1 type 4a pilus biogenesis protein PilO [Candidatus Thiothrix anitrata]